jgi:hypothetical protein
MRILSIPAALVAAFASLCAAPVYAQAPAVPFSGPTYPTPGAGGAPWAEAWAGFGVTNNWYGGWAGFNYAFSHNVWGDGLLLRGEGGGGHYDYTNGTLVGGVPVGFVNATYGQGAVLLGYRKVLPGIGVNTTVTGYLGAEVNDQNNPDPTAAIRGTKWGVKAIGEIYSKPIPGLLWAGLILERIR